jgi:hypothetical protein
MKPAVAIAVALHPLDIVAGRLATLGSSAQIVTYLVYFTLISFSRFGIRFLFFFEKCPKLAIHINNLKLLKMLTLIFLFDF